ncbi:hypothetical protein ACMFMF_006945 [Clarireedia jacksonii]
MAGAVSFLARTTSSTQILTVKPDKGYQYFKRRNGYVEVFDKFGHAKLTPLKLEVVRLARIMECLAQMEVEFVVKVLRTHVHETIKMEGWENRIDPDKWRPMIMSFQKLYKLTRGKVKESKLPNIKDEKYRAFSNAVEV